jgi:acyl dehydratase
VLGQRSSARPLFSTTTFPRSGTSVRNDPSRLASIGARISAPVYPGDTLRTDVWRDGDVVSFRTLVPERGNVVVLNNGRAELR